jgi:hypothetical protein
MRILISLQQLFTSSENHGIHLKCSFLDQLCSWKSRLQGVNIRHCENPQYEQETTSQYFNCVYVPISHIITHEYLVSYSSDYKDYSLLECHVMQSGTPPSSGNKMEATGSHKMFVNI